ncbi:MAG: hypothetical protein ISS35_09080, partial [Kiritimatiellae bacterium]|nr:hypothetical protein [Kiritimatiellia bacterium]
AWVEWGFYPPSSMFYRDYNADNNASTDDFGGGSGAPSWIPGSGATDRNKPGKLSPCKYNFEKLRDKAEEKADALQTAGSYSGNCYDFADEVVDYGLANSSGCTMP